MRRCSAYLSVLVSGGDKYSWMTIFFENLDMYYGGKGDKCRSGTEREGQWTGAPWRRRRLDNDETSWRRRRERVSGEEKRASGETVAAAVRSSQRSKPHHLALDRFVTHRFVTRRFVAHTFVAHRFVAQSCFKVE